MARHARKIVAAERDALLADIRALMTRWNIGSTTLEKMARIARKGA